MKRTMSASEWQHWYDGQEPLAGDKVIVSGRRMTVVEVSHDRIVMED